MEYLVQNIDLVKAAAWFFAGVACHRFSAKLIGYAQLSLFAEELNISLLRLIKSILDDMAFIKEDKYKTMRESSISEDEIQKIKKFDDQAYFSWKRDLVNRFLNAYPRAFYHTIKFSDWDDAMKSLEETDQKNG